MKTTLAPDLAVMPENQEGSSNHLFLFFKGHNNDYIWHAMLGPGPRWEGLGGVNDDRSPTNWAFTGGVPCAFNDSDLDQGRFGVRLVFGSHDSNRIWHTRMTWHRPIGAAPHAKWETPTPFPATVTTERSPSACLHPWDRNEPSLTVVYLEAINEMRNEFRLTATPGVRLVREFDAEPVELQTPDGELIRSRWSCRNGPVVASFNSRLYVFLHGVRGSDARLEYVRSTTNNFKTVRFDRRGTIPGVSTELQPAVTVHNDTLLMAFKGHTDHRIWLTRLALREVREDWENLQYVPDVETETAPALASYGGRLYLAFKPPHTNAVAAGRLVLGAGESEEDPGHVWQPLR